ncbi:hypothetical protein JCGZ_17107 [Jatropha curcas]|uniref:Uncharacterized protein n=1 Tax=Jatropha curcas TaxID=180498 RepID=A0A067K5S7_JATCU|nr:hypothetical protein JCGZ_17107 [Jatropha curcas]
MDEWVRYFDRLVKSGMSCATGATFGVRQLKRFQWMNGCNVSTDPVDEKWNEMCYTDGFQGVPFRTTSMDEWVRYFDRPNTIKVFDRRMDCAMVIVDSFCGYLAPIGGFNWTLHFGRGVTSNGLNWATPLREGHHFKWLNLGCSTQGCSCKTILVIQGKRHFDRTYVVFAQTQLLVDVPPLIEFDPFTEEEIDKGQGIVPIQQQQRSKRVWRGPEPRAPDTAVTIGTPEHRLGASFSFILDRTGQPAQGMLEMHLMSLYRMSPPGCTHVSIDDYNEVCQLYEAS